jgi:hypothetical protein
MGREQRAREAQGATSPRWKPAREAPDDAWPLAICGTLVCNCDGNKGGRIVVTGARHKGEWVMECEHEVDITHFMLLPMPPPH